MPLLCSGERAPSLVTAADPPDPGASAGETVPASAGTAEIAAIKNEQPTTAKRELRKRPI